MSYMVTLTFDLSDETSETYEKITSYLENTGLYKTVTTSKNKTFELPRNTYVGEFNGESSSKIRSDLTEEINKYFTQNNINAKIFILVGNSWSWSIRNT